MTRYSPFLLAALLFALGLSAGAEPEAKPQPSLRTHVR